MRKHLKLRGEWIQEERMVKVSLVSRTHTGYDFGNPLCKTTWDFCHNGFRIASDGSELSLHRNIKYSLVDNDSECLDTLDLPDELEEWESEYKGSFTIVSIEDWKRIKEVTIAYNNHEF